MPRTPGFAPPRPPHLLLVAFTVTLLGTLATGCPTFDESGTYLCDTVAPQCPPGFDCVEARCVRPDDGGTPPVVNGGTDAGPDDGGTPGVVDAGEPDGGEADAGEPGPTARIRFVNADEREKHDFWLNVGAAPQRVSGNLGFGEVSATVPVAPGPVTVFAAEHSPTLGAMPFPQAQQAIELAAGDDFVFTLGAGNGQASTYGFIRSEFSSSSRVDGSTFVHASRAFSNVALDLSSDGSNQFLGLAYGSSTVVGDKDDFDRARLFVEAAQGDRISFSTFAGFNSGSVAVLCGRRDVAWHAPDSVRLVVVPRDNPTSVVLADPWIGALNLLSPTVPLALRAERATVGTIAAGFGDRTGDRQTPPAQSNVEIQRTDTVPGTLKGQSLTILRGEQVQVIAYGNPANSANFVAFVDRTPRPVAGVVYDVLNATGGVLQPTLVVKAGTTELYRDNSFGPGDVTTNGVGRATAAATLTVSVSAVGLPVFDSSFNVTTTGGERLLMILEEGGTKPKLRVIRDLGPQQTSSVLSPQ